MDELEAARMRIYALEDGAVRAQALAFCLRAGLFDALDRQPATFEEISRAFDLSPRVLPALLAFLCSQDLLARDSAGRFGNTRAASAFLVRASPQYCGGRGLLFAGFFDAIAHLPGALATGSPWTGAGQHDMFDGFTPEQQEWFADGMFANAVHGAAALLREVDLRPYTRLLDVGGNAGGYAITILRAHPAMTATIFDVPAVREIALGRAAEHGMAERIAFVTGSFFEDPLPRAHDVLLLSSILHDWEGPDCRTILERCYEALDPGGLMVVAEPMLAEDSTGPDHPSVSGLTMALLGGENRTRATICQLLGDAGFAECSAGPLGHQNSVVTARRP